jgi:hypothetical protein
MAGHLLFNSGSNESSLAPQFKWLDNTFKNCKTHIVIVLEFIGIGWNTNAIFFSYAQV